MLVYLKYYESVNFNAGHNWVMEKRKRKKKRINNFITVRKLRFGLTTHHDGYHIDSEVVRKQ